MIVANHHEDFERRVNAAESEGWYLGPLLDVFQNADGSYLYVAGLK